MLRERRTVGRRDEPASLARLAESLALGVATSVCGASRDAIAYACGSVGGGSRERRLILLAALQGVLDGAVDIIREFCVTPSERMDVAYAAAETFFSSMEELERVQDHLRLRLYSEALVVSLQHRVSLLEAENEGLRRQVQSGASV